MNQQLLHHLSHIAESHSVYAEDMADQLMSRYTSLGLIVTAIFLVLKQYIFKPIQCWVPAEWPRPWEEYAENYCWIQNTYHVAFLETGHPGLQTRSESEINYFQWVPILLAVQSFLVYGPHLFWRLASTHSGCDPHRIVKLALELEDVQSVKKRHKLTHYVSSQLSRALTIAAAVHKKPTARQLSLRCGGSFLFLSYMASKVAYLLWGLGHLFLMKKYLGFEHLHFGWSCAVDLLQGRQWQQTRVFPRVTFCDVPIKHVGQWNTRSVQCVLPMNMLNEKLYIFLWFWVVFCMVLTVAYSVYWIANLATPSQRRRYIEGLLRMTHPPRLGKQHDVDQAAKEEFSARMLRLDGVFILQMVANRSGDLCAAQILEAMYDGRDHTRPSAGGSSVDVSDETLPLRGVAGPRLSSDAAQRNVNGKNGCPFGPRSAV